jgi:prepilin-type N-terminal cleavage/methylation domain-containing protein
VARDSGFSLIEMLVALALTLLVTGAMLILVGPAQTTAATQPDAADMLQRARAATEALAGSLAIAGAGEDAGTLVGPLADYLPPVVPRRLGLQRADGAAIARADVVTVLHVPKTRVQSRLSEPWPGASADLKVADEPSCPAGVSACGFTAGMTGIVFDSLGQFDLFDVTQVSGDSTHLRLHGPAPSGVYEAGANVSEAEMDTFYFDATASQLRHYDGYATDVPVIDNVVGLTFEYLGDPRPPVEPRPPLGTANCLYATAGESLAPLPLGMLTDGPWCGDGGMRFDADLLRIREVRVTLRVQAAPASLRATSPDFAKPGSSRGAGWYVPDFVAAFDIAPRNLNLGR